MEAALNFGCLPDFLNFVILWITLLVIGEICSKGFICLGVLRCLEVDSEFTIRAMALLGFLPLREFIDFLSLLSVSCWDRLVQQMQVQGQVRLFFMTHFDLQVHPLITGPQWEASPLLLCYYFQDIFHLLACS